MEWLGVLLLYLISGFMKKRQQNKNRKIIESDPDWDNEDYTREEPPTEGHGEPKLEQFKQRYQNAMLTMLRWNLEELPKNMSEGKQKWKFTDTWVFFPKHILGLGFVP